MSEDFDQAVARIGRQRAIAFFAKQALVAVLLVVAIAWWLA